MARGDCFYARFQDDIILISRKRHVLRRMRKEMFQILENLQLIIRPEKTQVGRCEKGFDLLGYHVTLKGLSPSIEAQKKAFEAAKRRFAQGGEKSLQLYLKRWRTWAHAGLNDQVQDVNGILNQIVYHINNDVTRPYKKKSRAVWIKTTVNRKGKQSWIRKFSGHWQC